MPILNTIDRRSITGRWAVICIYFLLIIGGSAMVYPFLVTITGSFGTHFDYHRRSVLPRFMWNRPDRLMRTLVEYFPPGLRNAMSELRGYFPDFPEDWRLWRQVGGEMAASDTWAASQLADLRDPAKVAVFRTMAEDLSAFTAVWNIEEAVLAYHGSHVAPFLRSRYETIEDFNQAWHLAVDTFNEVRAGEWIAMPLDQSGFVPRRDVRFKDLLAFRQAYKENRFSRLFQKDPVAVGYLRPAALAYTWESYAAQRLELATPTERAALPFPVPQGADEEMLSVWHLYLRERFPVRHVEIPISERLHASYIAFLRERFRDVSYLNRIMEAEVDFEWQVLASLDQAVLTSTIPDGVLPGRIWIDFVRNAVPVETWGIRDTLADKAFQQFAIERHGSIAAINAAYGSTMDSVAQLRIPFRGAFLHTFNRFEWQFAVRHTLGNFYIAYDNLVLRGKALQNTVILVFLTMLLTLTVNPLAAYALSRFRLRNANSILLFCVGTMAFPASVSAIPGFLLLRDLGLLNTFAALVLPTAANGMGIFLLKGFFDSLPQELFEAATIDGASEFQIFRVISLPLVKPILAVNALNAFIFAYNGWAWAILVAQDRSMWTLAVWTYQFSQIFSATPFVVMAAFLLNSLPVFLVFLFCQKIIMRGIVLPSMK